MNNVYYLYFYGVHGYSNKWSDMTLLVIVISFQVLGSDWKCIINKIIKMFAAINQIQEVCFSLFYIWSVSNPIFSIIECFIYFVILLRSVKIGFYLRWHVTADGFVFLFPWELLRELNLDRSFGCEISFFYFLLSKVFGLLFFL